MMMMPSTVARLVQLPTRGLRAASFARAMHSAPLSQLAWSRVSSGRYGTQQVLRCTGSAVRALHSSAPARNKRDYYDALGEF